MQASSHGGGRKSHGTSGSLRVRGPESGASTRARARRDGRSSPALVGCAAPCEISYFAGLHLLLVLLVASVSGAKEREVREPIERTIILSEHPRTEASKLYVGGRITTVLRFEKPCDPARTKMLGWEGTSR